MLTAIQRRRLTKARHRQTGKPPRLLADLDFNVEDLNSWTPGGMVITERNEPIRIDRTPLPWWHGRIE